MPLEFKWLNTDLIEDRLFTNVFSKLLQFFNTNKTMDSIVSFCRDNCFSYTQVLKYKKWLCLKGIIVSERKGRNEILRITGKGEKLVKAHTCFIKVLREIE